MALANTSRAFLDYCPRKAAGRPLSRLWSTLPLVEIVIVHKKRIVGFLIGPAPDQSLCTGDQVEGAKGEYRHTVNQFSAGLTVAKDQRPLFAGRMRRRPLHPGTFDD